MLNKITQGIAVKLASVFGENCKIYQNDVAQGLSPPCFMIGVLKASVKPAVNGMIQGEYPFIVRYYPQNNGHNDELIDVAAELSDALEIITAPALGTIRGTGMHGEIVDGILHYNVTYTLRMRKTEAERPTMETLARNP